MPKVYKKMTDRELELTEYAEKLFLDMCKKEKVAPFQIYIDYNNYPDKKDSNGYTIYDTYKNEVMLFVSKEYIKSADFENVKRTMAHELAHAIEFRTRDKKKALRRTERSLHGAKWKKLFKMSGYSPDYYNVGA